jgi:dTDP-4-dehydrorhamnose reductase
VLSVKVLVTGAGGQVGRALLESAPAGVDVLAGSHQELDVADEPATVASVRRQAPDVIVNTAAYTAVDRAESEPELARLVNGAGPRHLAHAAREVGARLIHISTDFVFDGSASVPYRPDAATQPLNVYGLTKLQGEKAVLETLPERSVIVRTAWVYAPWGHNFVRTMMRVMRSSAAVRVVRDQIGTPTSARSLAETIWKLVALPQVIGVHHWTDAGVASWYDFAVAIAEEAAQLDLLPANVAVTPIATREYPTPARRPSYSVLDTTSLTSLGIAPQHWRKHLRAVLRELGNG